MENKNFNNTSYTSRTERKKFEEELKNKQLEKEKDLEEKRKELKNILFDEDKNVYKKQRKTIWLQNLFFLKNDKTEVNIILLHFGNIMQDTIKEFIQKILQYTTLPILLIMMGLSLPFTQVTVTFFSPSYANMIYTYTQNITYIPEY